MTEDVPDLIVVHPGDTVATALKTLPAGTNVRVQRVDAVGNALMLRQAIALGHKVAIAPIAAGALVIKHGFPIGRAIADIAPGEHVHIHNVISLSRETVVSSSDQDRDNQSEPLS